MPVSEMQTTSSESLGGWGWAQKPPFRYSYYEGEDPTQKKKTGQRSAATKHP